MSDLSLLDVLRTAVAVEKAGKALYEELSESGSLPDPVRAALKMLAMEESSHLGDFESMLERYGGRSQSDLRVVGTKEGLLRWVSLFAPERLSDETDELGSAEDVLAFASRREMDTIMFYSEIRDVLSDELDVEVVEWIIEQERAHFHRVNDLMAELEAGSDPSAG